MRDVLLFLLAAALLLMWPFGAGACTLAWVPRDIGQTFKVQAKTSSRGIEGLHLVLQKNDKGAVKIDAVTDNDGYAEFSHLTAGVYSLRAETEVGWENQVVLNVKSSQPDREILEFNWPGHTPVSAQTAAGVLRGPNFYEDAAQQVMDLQLTDGLSGRVLGSTTTDATGSFHFAQKIAPGIYFVKITKTEIRGWDGEPILGAMAFEIDPAAQSSTFDLDLGWSSCGLGYVQQAKYAESTVHSLCGDVTDPAGGKVQGAQISVLPQAPGAEAVKTGTADTSGRFSIPNLAVGSYRLLVESPGFAAHLNPLRVETPVAATCTESQHIELVPSL